MRGKDLLECMEYIDDALIQEALESPPNVRRKNRTNLSAKWGFAAACIAMVSITAAVFWPHQNIQNHSESMGADTASPIVMDTTSAGDGESDGNLTENMPAEGSMASGTQADMGTGGQGAAGHDTMSGSTKQNSAEEAASAKDSAATVELQDEAGNIADTESERLSYTVIRDYYGEKDDSVYDYVVPAKGKYFCYHYLQETIAYYDTQENASDTADSLTYAYEVMIDLYGDIEKNDGSGIHYEQLNMLENLDIVSEKIEQEYRRLAELGYSVRLSEDFQLTGTFTKVELDTFQASPEYGYTFRFANEY